MHPELAALLRDARRRPDDDPARLVLADWLDENGDDRERGWAELIRVEVRLASLNPDNARRWPLLDRAALLRDKPLGWAGPLTGPPGVGLTGPAGGLCRLTLRPYPSSSGLNWVGLEGSPLWPFIDGLHLFVPHDQPGWRRLYDDALREVLTRIIPEGPGLLALHHATSEDTAAVLIGSPGLARLTSLDLTASGLNHHFLLPLLTSPRLKGLIWLALGDCHLDAYHAGLLAASPYLGQLATLDLCNNDLGPAGVERLGQCRARPRHLGLALNNLHTTGVKALLATPLAAHLRSLDLTANGIGDRGAALLAASPQLAGLQRLSLDRNGLDLRGARALAESPYLGGLSYLYVNLESLGPWEQDLLVQRFGDRVR